MTYSRWVKYNNRADVPKDVHCCCVVAKTKKPCGVRPRYFIVSTEKWACGRHLQKALPECSVCLCDMQRYNEKRLPCGHVFHTLCVRGLEAHTDEPKCPVCRAPYFPSGWAPNPLPDGYTIDWSEWSCSDETCRDHIISDHTKLLYSSLFMDIVQYHRFRSCTAQELTRREGCAWYLEFGEWLGQSVLEDGDIVWGRVDYDHSFIKQCHSLEKWLHSSPPYFFAPDNI